MLEPEGPVNDSRNYEISCSYKIWLNAGISGLTNFIVRQKDS